MDLFTGHANSLGIFKPLESLVLMGAELPLLAIRKQIASALDIIVHLGRLRDKSRRVLSIVEVLDCKEGEIQMNPLFAFEETGEEDGKILGELKRENDLVKKDKLYRAGIKCEYSNS